MNPAATRQRLALIRAVHLRRKAEGRENLAEADALADDPTDAYLEMLAPERAIAVERKRVDRSLEGGRGASNREEWEEQVDDGEINPRELAIEEG